ncbi:Tryptophan--tRNA ligase [bacterium HR19]|nr:Tryptophan--tRNA ligase [bacterium HR19]
MHGEIKGEKKEEEKEKNKENEVRVLSGMRPTGSLHIGHLRSVLEIWKNLQDEGKRCFYLVADLHALTTEWDNSKK